MSQWISREIIFTTKYPFNGLKERGIHTLYLMKKENIIRATVIITALTLLLLLCSIGATFTSYTAIAENPQTIDTVIDVLGKKLTLKVDIPLNRQLKAIEKGGYEVLCRSLLKEGVPPRQALTYISEDLSNIWDYLSSLETPASPAELIVNEYGFDYKKEVCGLAFNKCVTAIKIASSLDGKSESLSLEKVEPKETINSLKEKTILIGSFSTDISSSSENRKNNISLATTRLNGQTVKPQEELSFNKVVGKRCVEEGFLEATVISDGEYVLGVGGGICQVATTFYNALIRAGFICNAHSHSYPTSYVPPSLDCMVSEYTDFLFKNTSDDNVYIFGGLKNGRVWFEIYGKKRESIVPLSRIVKRTPFENVNEEGLCIDVEGMTLISKGVEGIVSEAYYITSSGEEVIFRKNVYKTKNAVWKKTKE